MNWRPSVSTVKADIKFFIATTLTKPAHNVESETEGSVDEEKERDGQTVQPEQR